MEDDEKKNLPINADSLTDEQTDRLILEINEHIKKGTFSKYRAKGLAKIFREMKEEDGTYTFKNQRTEENIPISQWTMEKRISRLVQNWKKYLAEDMKYMMIEAAYMQAQKAKESPAAFSNMTKVLEMEKNEEDAGIKISPSLIAILQRKGVGTALIFGKNTHLKRVRDKGHERPDSRDSVAPGQFEAIAFEVVSSGDDTTLHGGDTVRDNAEGIAVSDTEMAPEDTVDNDGGADMDVTE